MKLSELPKDVSTLVGIVLTVIGASIMAAGSVFTKKGIEQHAMLTGRLRMYPVSSPTWAVSQAAYLFGVLVHFAALAFAPASVLAPTNSVGLVVNALMSAVSFGMSGNADSPPRARDCFSCRWHMRDLGWSDNVWSRRVPSSRGTKP
ncbi:MAG: uncharacterized protein KVP18_003455 [Porospora cf. gigantea A]|uniref:uncharacterized protein n=1 Tax=Porospora cf. gigantea A TaxID=2853593 RepID=UPI0035593CA3|nr:MAG: hypothetical protein KVP18_003455 [Porospora cf. gigantea A]